MNETYTYAGDGMRLSSTSGGVTTNFLFDRTHALPQLAFERDGAGAPMRTYGYGLDLVAQQDDNADLFYYHHDGLGSVSDITDDTGAPLAWYEYDPYGELRLTGTATGVPNNPFLFTGEQLDSVTGLYHLRARQYDPGTGRFLSQDPMTLLLPDPHVASYAYTNNHPVSRTDPSGNCFWVCGAIGAIGGSLVGAASYTVQNVTSGDEWDWGEFTADVAGGAVGGAIVGFTGGASMLIPMATPVGYTYAARAVVSTSGSLLGWSGETITKHVLGHTPTRDELLSSLALAAAGPAIEKMTFEGANNVIAVVLSADDGRSDK